MVRAISGQKAGAECAAADWWRGQEKHPGAPDGGVNAEVGRGKSSSQPGNCEIATKGHHSRWLSAHSAAQPVGTGNVLGGAGFGARAQDAGPPAVHSAFMGEQYFPSRAKSILLGRPMHQPTKLKQQRQTA